MAEVSQQSLTMRLCDANVYQLSFSSAAWSQPALSHRSPSLRGLWTPSPTWHPHAVRKMSQVTPRRQQCLLPGWEVRDSHRAAASLTQPGRGFFCRMLCFSSLLLSTTTRSGQLSSVKQFTILSARVLEKLHLSRRSLRKGISYLPINTCPLTISWGH